MHNFLLQKTRDKCENCKHRNIISLSLSLSSKTKINHPSSCGTQQSMAHLWAPPISLQVSVDLCAKGGNYLWDNDAQLMKPFVWNFRGCATKSMSSTHTCAQPDNHPCHKSKHKLFPITTLKRWIHRSVLCQNEEIFMYLLLWMLMCRVKPEGESIPKMRIMSHNLNGPTCHFFLLSLQVNLLINIVFT
jgi:hypothetical protein